MATANRERTVLRKATQWKGRVEMKGLEGEGHVVGMIRGNGQTTLKLCELEDARHPTFDVRRLARRLVMTCRLPTPLGEVGAA